MRALRRFCSTIDETREPETMTAKELDKLLSRFFKDITKENGEEYEPSTLASFQRSFQRYFSEKKLPFNTFEDDEFSRSRQVLAAKRKSLVQSGFEPETSPENCAGEMCCWKKILKQAENFSFGGRRGDKKQGKATVKLATDDLSLQSSSLQIFIQSFSRTGHELMCVSGAQRSSVLLSFGESDGRLDAAVVPHPCKDVAQPYCVPFPTEAETSHQNTELNDIETGSDSDIVYVSEHVPVSVSVPVSQLPPKRIIQAHRLNIKNDLIDLFRDPVIMSQDIAIIVIDARGVEEVGRDVGLLRDVFSLFWKETYDSLFVGENERVPFSFCLKRSLLVFLGGSAVTSAMLTQSFRNYIAVDEKCLIDKCLAGDMKWDDEDEMSQLLEVFSNYDCRIMVNSENVSQVIEEIAHKELLQKPQCILQTAGRI
ncbi:hypothetical protein AWC38_SpisGene15814 [Stylophora pistillata]|uniref:Uncharacterized protein n=1 Tax=Stylophora pistillata TaxID=50429 RepID=A0A2B4RTA2_STYPI|nr:hypothetical protein AWC38_SpisGene15814 [Stylophora pistillata]